MKLREWERLVQVVREMQQGIYPDSEHSIYLTDLISDPPTPAAYGESTTSMQNVHGDNFVGDKTQYNNTGSGPMINHPSGSISFGGT
jgi:hypothetical protein